ncbi:hypothetical protein WJX77_010266 [Trebouxia sp. C0004]
MCYDEREAAQYRIDDEAAAMRKIASGTSDLAHFVKRCNLVQVAQKEESTPSSSGGHQHDSASIAGMDARDFKLPHVDSAPEVPEVGGTGEVGATDEAQEPASRESSKSDASAVSASGVQAAPTPLQAEAIDASDKVLGDPLNLFLHRLPSQAPETLDSQQLNEDLLRLTNKGQPSSFSQQELFKGVNTYLDLPVAGDTEDKEAVSNVSHG